jgi:hypothetical protein
MAIMDILTDRLGQRADTLAAAYVVNEVAYAAHIRAQDQRKDDPRPETAHAIGVTAAAWDEARGQIVQHAQALMGTLAIYLASAPHNQYEGLRRQVEYVNEAFRAEAIAFNRYSNISGGSREMRQEWQDTRGEIISRARPLIVHVRALIAPMFESGTPTEIGN